MIWLAGAPVWYPNSIIVSDPSPTRTAFVLGDMDSWICIIRNCAHQFVGVELNHVALLVKNYSSRSRVRLRSGLVCFDTVLSPLC